MEILYDIMKDEATFLGHLPSRFSNLESAAYFFCFYRGTAAKCLLITVKSPQPPIVAGQSFHFCCLISEKIPQHTGYSLGYHIYD